MFEILVPLFAGVTLVIFIFWEEFRPQKRICRKTFESGFEPGLCSKVEALLVLGATGMCFGLYLIANPQHPPFTGSGALLSTVLYSIFGQYGQPLLSFGLSVAAISAGFVIKRSRSHQKKHLMLAKFTIYRTSGKLSLPPSSDF